MSKTMDTPDAEEANNVQLKILGEYGHIISFACCEGERNLVKERLLFFLRLRMLRNNHDPRKVIAAYDDTCCQNLKDPANHFLPLLFQSCSRAPLKDVWHGVQVIARQTAGFGHPLHDAFISGLWDLILKWDKESQDEALEHYMQHNENGKQLLQGSGSR